MQRKKCKECGLIKTLAEFSPHPWAKYKVRPRCKLCRNKMFQERRKEMCEYYKRKGIDLSKSKQCRVCGKTKEPTEFGFQAMGKQGLSSECRECLNKRARKSFYKRYPYYIELLEKQNNACAICGATSPDPNGKLRRFPVDHNHNTGMVRGLLCNRCNRALGLLGSDVAILEEAIEYLTTAKTDYIHWSHKGKNI